MSKLRDRLTKMAEPSAWVEQQQEQKKKTPRNDSQAVRDYPDQRYQNQKGDVSPLNIILMDYANTIYNMSFDDAVSFVIDNIQALNSKYSGDPFYDTFSESSGGYLRKLEYTMKNLKPKTIDNLLMYLQNAMYKGMTRLNEEENYNVTLAEIYADKDKLYKMACLLDSFKNKK